MLIDDRRVVPLTLLAQAGVAAALAVLLGVWIDGAAGISALLGGAASVIPNAFLAARLVNPRHGDAAAIMRSAWVGVIGKWLITALLFSVIFLMVKPISGLAVFGGFIAAQSVILWALLVGAGPTSMKLGTKS